MKKKILYGLFTLLTALFTVACSSDDDYTAATGTLVNGVTTGTSDVTATTATLHATVEGDLSAMSSSFYKVAFRFGPTKETMTSTSSSLKDNAFSTTMTGLQENTTYYYQAVLTLQGKVTYTGEMKSLVTTDATVTTAAAETAMMQAVLGGTVTNLPTSGEPSTGVVIAATADEESVRGGLVIPAAEAAPQFSVTKKGLLPGKTYYYAAYLNLGTGIVYGDVKSFTTPEHAVDVNEDFVDLGLSTKWCKFNVGATAENQLGGLFAFGDLTGVNNSMDAADYASADIYRTALDLANVTYRQTTLPTALEFEELFQSCSYVWVTKDDVSGLEFTGPNGNKLFLPAAGERSGNDVSGEGVLGAYLTGSVNPNSSAVCDAYRFSQSGGSKASSGVYMALSVRPVSTAKNVAFDKSLLYNTWYLDIDEDSKCRVFAGPLYFYGSDDNWGTVTNGEPAINIDSWAWQADYAGNTWLCEAKDYGSMTFSEDGKVVVNQGGTVTEGTFTVDEANKTITLEGAEILYLDNYRASGTNWSKSLRILSLDEKGLQIGVMRDNDSQGLCQWSFNYVNADVRKPSNFEPSLCLYDGDDNNWGSFTTSEKLEAGKQYTIEATASRNAAKVFIFDIPGLAENYPNAIIRIDKIETDGKEVAFDGNKFKYGNLEGKGTYRVELFNIWGAGTNNDSPFGGGAKEAEPALAFSSSLKITYTVVTLEGFTAGLTTCDSNWNSAWPDASVPVAVNGGFPQTYTISYDSSRANGMIYLVELQNFSTSFPNAKLSLQSVSCDGNDVAFDASKILYGDLEGKGHYRIELYNTYGGTHGNSPFEGETADGNIPALGFTSNITVVFTIDKLY